MKMSVEHWWNGMAQEAHCETVLGPHAGVRGSEIADKLSRDGSVQRFVGPEPFLGVSK